MEFYTCEELRSICHEHDVVCTQMSKNEMYALLVEKGLIDKVPEKSPAIIKDDKILTNICANALNAYTEKYYLGEEYRDVDYDAY